MARCLKLRQLPWVAATLLVACHRPGPEPGVPVPQINAVADGNRITLREHFLAAGEMQISGEPLAEALGRNLTGYSRDHLPTDIYFDPSPTSSGPWVDLPGFSTGVESYEYSKQTMNNVAFESGAGTSLLYGPLINPNGLGGAAAVHNLAASVLHFATGSHALNRFVFAPGSFPAGDGNRNVLGWPGMWPVAHAYRSFDPHVAPTHDSVLQCTISSDDDPGASGALGCADYECDATSLHLPQRASQVEAVLTPGTDGFSAWKYGLWVINYLQIMHDSGEAAVSTVDNANVAQVGDANNALVGADDQGNPTAAGTYLGSSDIEGFQAQMLITGLDNAAADWLTALSTRDGTHLGGFASLQEALTYNEAAPLTWFAGAVNVQESDDGSGFPKPAYTLASPNSDAMDLLGVAMGYAELYALTDTANTQVGGAQPAQAIFDGDPFAADNQQPDGENTVHDRALAMMRVAMVNLDRLHVQNNLVADSATLNGNQVTRGTSVSTPTVAYTVLSLRTVLRSLTSQLQLYSNNTPDTAGASTPLDALPLAFPGDASATFGSRARALIQSHANLLMQLTDAAGRAAAGWDSAAQAPTGGFDTLDAHTAAVRGLFASYLATGNTQYRDRAVAVFKRMQSVFYDPVARLYTTTPGSAQSVTYTPLRFALLQSSLRDMFELVGSAPGNEALGTQLTGLLARLNKLVLNGWDDRNGNSVVDWPDECVQVRDGLPRGALQMAERTLTGEIGSLQEQLAPGQSRTATQDREHDCVPEIDDAGLPATLAESVTFTVE